MSIVTETAKELAASAVKATPPITITGLSLAGFTMQDWVLTATLIYTVLQILILVRDKVLRIGPKEPLHERIRQRIRRNPRH